MSRKLDPANEDDRAFVERITRVARILCDYQEARRLQGACHELSAMGYILLRESGIEQAELCIGVAHSPYVPAWSDSVGTDFDHSWIEIGGAPVDVACASPREGTGPSLAPVVCGIHVDDGRPSEIKYGVSGSLDDVAARVAGSTLAEYFDAFDREGEPTPWVSVVALGKGLGLALDVAALRRQHGDVRWSLR